MTALRSLLYSLLFYSGTLAFVIVGLFASIVGQRQTEAVVLGWSRANAWAARHLLGINISVEGDVPPGPHLFAVKHQSSFETLEMVRIARCPVMVIKRELADMPLFGWLTRRYGIIAVDREAGARALRDMLAASSAIVAAKRSVVIYPEGTRVPVGASPPLQPGFAGLYRALKLPVVPVAMDSGRLFGRGLIKPAGTITFRIGETIPSGLKRGELEARVHAAINALESGAQASA